MTIVTLGRICAQKGPDWFADAHDHYRGDEPWVWVGGAADDKSRKLEQRLLDSGVIVTGWMERGEAMSWLEQASIYVHTAAWEGFPVTILEAAAFGLPVLARNIPAVAHEGIEYLMVNPEHMARWVEQLGNDRYQYRRAVASSVRWFDRQQGMSTTAHAGR